ncbi:hypothetical protein [Methanotorris formicicus]|uniref:Uncharacterized protein n=1 Tax=Methanotorris formicicus Mc-S-70 TaxID=647171 RepID=H1KYY9_9EURY|nr:hypothetical protein [Methanotorris formicicus]EHP86569.1 hypothetical protein MetfoDRAFT_1009 [Methanotorris formicicus Mc-S-70]
MIKKIISKKGFIITYEAIAIVLAFVGIFYVGYMAYTHNYLTTLEEIRDIGKFEKCDLIVDVLFKEAELPSNGYESDYIEFLKNVSKRYWGLERMPGTFNPYANITMSKKFYFVNNSPVEIVSNVNTSPLNLASRIDWKNTYVKSRNLLVPIKTWKYTDNNILEDLISGDVLYFMSDGCIPNIEASSDSETYAVFLVNGVPFNISLNNTPKDTNFTKVIEIHEPNELKLIKANDRVHLKIICDYTVYVLKLRPCNISCHVEMS